MITPKSGGKILSEIGPVHQIPCRSVRIVEKI